MTSARNNVFAHESFATRLRSERAYDYKSSSIQGLRAGIKQTDATSMISSDPIIMNPERDAKLNADPLHGGKGPVIDPNFRPDLGSTLRLKKRLEVIESAHKSLARHQISAQAKYGHRDLFQNRLRLNHITGKYEDSNWADPAIPVSGVGIALEQNLIHSLLIPAATISELRVSAIDPKGAAGLNKRIRIGDILLQVGFLLVSDRRARHPLHVKSTDHYFDLG